MTRVAHGKTRLRITSNINFRKSCWGVIKSKGVFEGMVSLNIRVRYVVLFFLDLIEKNAGDGVKTHYNHLGELHEMYKYLKLL